MLLLIILLVAVLFKFMLKTLYQLLFNSNSDKKEQWRVTSLYKI